jgi:hypothetical protein
VQLCQLIVLAGEWAAQQEAKARQAELEAPPVEKVWDDFFGWLTPEGEWEERADGSERVTRESEWVNEWCTTQLTS